jgi:hypothetical protein
MKNSYLDIHPDIRDALANHQAVAACIARALAEGQGFP